MGELVNIPGFRQEDTQAKCPGAYPAHGLCFDAAEDVAAAGLGVFEGAVVSLLPEHPGGEQSDRSEAFTLRLWGNRLGRSPPVFDCMNGI